MQSKVFPHIIKMIFVAAFVLLANPEMYAAPTPFIWPTQNPSCATLNASTDPRVAHMVENWEYKVDPAAGGMFALTGSGLAGGMPANANMFLNVALNGSGTAMTSWSLSWTAPQFVNRLVSAVIVKGGNGGAHVYPYNPLDAGDAGPFVLPTGQQLSHLSFCFETFTAPSSSSASIRGRVLTAEGRPISGAVVTVVNLNTGESTNLLTGTFGTYAIKGLPVGNFYSVSVSSRRFFFDDPSRTFELAEDLTDYDFVAR